LEVATLVASATPTNKWQENVKETGPDQNRKDNSRPSSIVPTEWRPESPPHRSLLQRDLGLRQADPAWPVHFRFGRQAHPGCLLRLGRQAVQGGEGQICQAGNARTKR